MKMVYSNHTHPKGPGHKHLEEPVQESQQTEEYVDGEECLKLMEAMCLDHPQK